MTSEALTDTPMVSHFSRSDEGNIDVSSAAATPPPLPRSQSNASADSRPDPPSHRGKNCTSVPDDRSEGKADSSRGIDVLARHRHNESIHISQVQLADLKSQQYFVSVPSDDNLLKGTPEDEEMTEELNDDSQRPWSFLLDAVKLVKDEFNHQEGEVDDGDEQDGGRNDVSDDISSARSATASASATVESSPTRKHIPNYAGVSLRSPSSMTSNGGNDDYRYDKTHSNVGASITSPSRMLLYPGPDEDVALLPRVDEHLISQTQQHLLLHQSPPAAAPQGLLPGPVSDFYTNTQANRSQTSLSFAEPSVTANRNEQIHRIDNNGGNGRRKIRLRLFEEVPQPIRPRSGSILGHLRRRSTSIMFGSMSDTALATATGTSASLKEPNSNTNGDADEQIKLIPRGTVTISWFEGTSTLELQDYVRKTVQRKLGLDRSVDIVDFRIFDDSVNPPEEILLCPFIPDGTELVFRYTTRDQNDGASTPLSIYSGRAPDSPSAAPSPRQNYKLAGMSASQLASLREQLNHLVLPKETPKLNNRKKHKTAPKTSIENGHQGSENHKEESGDKYDDLGGKVANPKTKDELSFRSNRSKPQVQPMESDCDSVSEGDENAMVFHSEDPIEAGLHQIMGMLVQDRQRRDKRYRRRTTKRQVIFILANYFVLFLSAIAIFAEIQARLPAWQTAIEAHLTNVQDCAADKDTLFKCIENGDLAGLSASVILYLSRSVATRRFFLLGFDSPKKLWTVVYEALVTSVCWGFSYLFIRRGLNPDTRDRFLHKYWKDAVYGSLAGFNAAFMKAVLKNLIPQEAVEDALRERGQLKIFAWLPSVSKDSSAR